MIKRVGIALVMVAGISIGLLLLVTQIQENNLKKRELDSQVLSERAERQTQEQEVPNNQILVSTPSIPPQTQENPLITCNFPLTGNSFQMTEEECFSYTDCQLWDPNSINNKWYELMKRDDCESRQNQLNEDTNRIFEANKEYTQYQIDKQREINAQWEADLENRHN